MRRLSLPAPDARRSHHRWLRTARRAAAILVAAVGCELGPASADAHAVVSPNNELSWPTGRFAGKPPLGWMLVVHGGGWLGVGKETVILSRPYADFFRAQGWGTYNVDYRAGALSLGDVVSAYDYLRRRVGSRATICTWGGSAGGHLALMLAGDRPAVACVITEAAPTNLLTFTSQPVRLPAGAAPGTGPRGLMAEYIVPSFGSSREQLWWWSPVRVAARIRARLLLGASSDDFVVPPGQMWDMKRAKPDGTSVMLLAGAAMWPPNFMHVGVTTAALASWRAAERRLLVHARATEQSRTRVR